MPATALNLPIDSPDTGTGPQRLRRVLIVSDHPTESLKVTKNLRRLDLDVQLTLFDGNTLSSVPTATPDAILCHLIDYPEFSTKLAKVMKAHYKSKSVPLIGAMSRPALSISEAFDSTIFAPMHASQIANRVNAMIRLGIMEGEIERRLETLKEDFGQTPEISDFAINKKFRVLFIGKASPSFMVIINALQDKGVDVIAAFTSFSAFDYLHGEPFDAVIMNALEHSEPTFSISEAMRRNSKLYHTPTLFLVNGETFTDFEGAYARGARDIIDMHADSDEISGRILELANYHRVHEQLKLDFQQISIEVASDSSKSAYSPEFMLAHLPRMVRDAEKMSRPLTLVGLKLLPSSIDNVVATAIESAFAETIELIGNLIRMQDVLCRWEEDTLILSLFDTTEAEARIVLNRIRALLDCSIFESGSLIGNGLSISAQSKIIGCMDGSIDVKNMLAGLVASLRQDPDEV